EDFSNIQSISKIKVNETCCLQGKILEIGISRTWKKKMFLTEAIVEDKTGAIKVIWFNQPYLTQTLNEGDWVCLAGKVSSGKKGVYLSSPAYEKFFPSSNFQSRAYNLTHTGRIVPVYPETEGLSS
ncbi:unnamed protein product, partial [marine sediment metagenome]